MGTFTSMFNQENQIEKVLFLGLDVSMRKNKDQQNTSLIEAINQSTLKMEFDIEGQFISINERLMKALQLSNDEVKKMSIKDFILDDPRRNFATIWKNISRSIPYEGRIGMRNKQHDVLWFYGNFSHINSQISQSEEKVVLIASDITRQVEIEEKSKTQTKRLMEQEELLKAHSEELSQKLREAKEEMRTQYKEIEIVKALNEKTLEGALDAIIAINQFGKIEFFNEAAEELWDIAKRDILGKHIVELLPEIHATLGDNYMGAYLRISDSTVLRQRNEVFFINQDGQKENVLITLSEAKDGDNYRLTGFIQKVELELF
jgi:PAS domain S-box-containing protein